MSEYIVSARKYRPASFASLIGQDNIAQTLKNSVLRGQLAHAYLFCGPRGVGKTSAARIFAKVINCANPGPELEPCGKCESCVSFNEGRSYCIHELDAASNNSVDDIKTLIDQVNIPPQVGKYSVFIVDEVHMLSQAAFNAFLKTLEEPPAHAIFILATTEKHKILPTILSRCQTYDFGRISVPDIVRNLRDIAGKEGIKIEDEALHVIAMKADGAMRDALTIFDQTVAFCGNDIKAEEVMKNLNVLSYDHCFSLVDAFLAGDHSAALRKFDEILSKGFNALHFIGSLSSHLRDLIVAKSDGLTALLELPESLVERYREQAARCPFKFLYDALAATVACEGGYRASINPRLHIEFCLMRICALSGGAFTAPATPSEAAPAKAVKIPDQVGNDGKAVGNDGGKPAVAAPAAKASAAVPVAEEPAEPIMAGPDRPSPAKTVKIPDQVGTDGKAVGNDAEKPRRRTAPGALSLNALQKEEEAAPEAAAAGQAQSGQLPDDESIIAAWKTLSDTFADRPRLQNTLSGSKLEISEDDGFKQVSFFVVNVAQKDWIREKILKDLEQKLRNITGSSKVRLEVDVTADEEVKKQSYTPREQAEELINSNPEIRNLVKDMSLDV